MLPIQRDVLQVYLNERGDWGKWATDNQLPKSYKSNIEFDGTITEPSADGAERVVVARWSIDLLGRISVRLMDAGRS
jgi:hypothetical protein